MVRHTCTSPTNTAGNHEKTRLKRTVVTVVAATHGNRYLLTSYIHPRTVSYACSGGSRQGHTIDTVTRVPLQSTLTLIYSLDKASCFLPIGDMFVVKICTTSFWGWREEGTRLANVTDNSLLLLTSNVRHTFYCRYKTHALKRAQKSKRISY